MEDMKNNLKAYMEGLMTRLIQEMIPNGGKIVEETHDEKKRNVNHDFIDFNVGFKTHHIPKIDMRKFVGKDPLTWILLKGFSDYTQYYRTLVLKSLQQMMAIGVWKTWILKMEQYFDLNNVQHTKKVHIETLYLEPN